MSTTPGNIPSEPKSIDASMDLERFEAKYIIHPSLVPAIREFIVPFCDVDPHAPAGSAEYVVTTLQLDTDDMALYRAKEEEAVNRFKLRVRTYGMDGSCPVFLEIKRKIKGVISKSRATMPYSDWGPDACLNPSWGCSVIHPGHANNYLDFARLIMELGARPKVLIRYHRESYLGTNDQYARVTLDRKLCYRAQRSWELLPANGRWWSMDSALATRNTYSGVVLELKTFGDAPVWMVDMTERFNLVRVGFSKYFNAVRLESLFSGGQFSETGEPCYGG